MLRSTTKKVTEDPLPPRGSDKAAWEQILRIQGLDPKTGKPQAEKKEGKKNDMIVTQF